MIISAQQLANRRGTAQRNFEEVFPATIQVPGLATGDVVCAGGTIAQTGGTLVPGGLLVDFALAFRVRKELLTGVPVADRTNLIYGGVTYQIKRVVNSPHDVAYFLGADNVNK